MISKSTRTNKYSKSIVPKINFFEDKRALMVEDQLTKKAIDAQ
jgi:hypothetical protein